MAKIPTVHNPVNFDPASYEVVDYLDNKRPGYYGQGIEAFEAEVKFWEADMLRVFGEDWRKKVRRCVHCGNGRVRWITATKHLPTGQTVVFGSDCTFRLDFANKQEWKLAVLKSKAEAGHARIKVWNARVKFLEANPAFAAAVEQAKNAVHAKNSFVQDVVGKLNIYGSLSERQVAAVLKSLARDVEVAGQKAVEATEVKGNAPEGRQTVTGVILSTKRVEGFYGVQEKMLVKLENNSRVWTTVPSKADAGRGDTITFTASFEVSKDDKSFGFGKRPTLVSVAKAVAA
jgi:hypothetical protein